MKNVIWAIERHVRLLKKDESKRSTKEILAARDRMYNRYLEADRKGNNTGELFGWLSALEWVLGAENGKKK